MDDPRSGAAPAGPPLVDGALPPYLVAGNRFGSYGFGAGLTGLLLTLAPFGHSVAWVLVIAAIVLSLTGGARYASGGATNRDVSIVGLAMGWIGLMGLLVEASIALNLPPDAYMYVYGS